MGQETIDVRFPSTLYEYFREQTNCSGVDYSKDTKRTTISIAHMAALSDLGLISWTNTTPEKVEAQR